jgi:hypothetical protein
MMNYDELGYTKDIKKKQLQVSEMRQNKSWDDPS